MSGECRISQWSFRRTSPSAHVEPSECRMPNVECQIKNEESWSPHRIQLSAHAELRRSMSGATERRSPHQYSAVNFSASSLFGNHSMAGSPQHPSRFFWGRLFNEHVITIHHHVVGFQPRPADYWLACPQVVGPAVQRASNGAIFNKSIGNGWGVLVGADIADGIDHAINAEECNLGVVIQPHAGSAPAG